jgi:mannose-6-phosphate isomerase
MGPLRFEPAFKTMLWGGTRLRPYFGQLPSDEPTGEAWVLSDVDGTESVVANGPFRGRTLRQLLAEYPREILGGAEPVPGRFPLLLKFIDTRQALSVQVHPDDRLAARKKPGQNGKTEAWVVVGTSPESTIYSGFVEGMTEAKFRAALETKTVPQTLHAFAPAVGDCLFLEAGTVHAIGAGLMVFEVQQTSDITYRLYDWDRVDAKTGRPRELHVEDGLESANFASGPCRPVVPVRRGDWDVLVECPFFTLRHANRTESLTVPADGARAVVCIQGHGTLDGEPMKPGDTVLVPACLGGYDLAPDGPMRVLECGVV